MRTFVNPECVTFRQKGGANTCQRTLVEDLYAIDVEHTSQWSVLQCLSPSRRMAKAGQKLLSFRSNLATNWPSTGDTKCKSQSKDQIQSTDQHIHCPTYHGCCPVGFGSLERSAFTLRNEKCLLFLQCVFCKVQDVGWAGSTEVLLQDSDRQRSGESMSKGRGDTAPWEAYKGNRSVDCIYTAYSATLQFLAH